MNVNKLCRKISEAETFLRRLDAFQRSGSDCMGVLHEIIIGVASSINRFFSHFYSAVLPACSKKIFVEFVSIYSLSLRARPGVFLILVTIVSIQITVS